MPAAVRGRELWLDGYNVLTVLESALAGGVVLLGRDGCCRDIAGIHRRYRKVNETVPGLHLVGEAVTAWGVSCCRWWLDKPVFVSRDEGVAPTFCDGGVAATRSGNGIVPDQFSRPCFGSDPESGFECRTSSKTRSRASAV